MARFIDEATIEVKAGDGGNGSVSFHRGPHVPKGGPDGGDGARGGTVYGEASENLQSLLDFRYQKKYRAERGEDGSGSNCNGRSGKDVTLYFPMGTLIRFVDTGEEFDLAAHGQKIILAKGGKGGLGNTNFKSSTRQTPMFSTPGTPGEEREIQLELRSMSDVGLVGLPNAGKSSLLQALTSARPKIAPYPFTTLQPQLGVAGSDLKYTIADIPGLVEGAHLNVGLGHRFLRHISRAQILIYVIGFDSERNLETDYQLLRHELAMFDRNLLKRTSLIVVNKSDLLQTPDAPTRWADEWIEFHREHPESLLVSALQREGLEAFEQTLQALLLHPKLLQVC